MPYYESAIKKFVCFASCHFEDISHVAHEIYVALTHFQSLVPMMDRYVYNDGTIKNLMSLTGTIPVTFKDKTYNIPTLM
uniref:Zgc:123278 n=1 Tax=Cyclopterus lumpus TaxID=8103 RepID=A0A8C3B1B2_CYCLU